MTDLLSPTDPAFGGGQLGVTSMVRPKMGQSQDEAQANIFRPTGIAQLDDWMTNWQRLNFGRVLDTQDHQLIDQIGQTLNGRSLIRPQVFKPMEVNLDERPEAALDLDPAKAFANGFDGSLMGALRRWNSVDARMSRKDDPNYDLFADRQIDDSPYKDQRWMFMNSGSADETAWMINYFRRHERESAQVSRMSGAGLFDAAGGMLGDPLTYMPLKLGAAGVQLAKRTALLGSPEAAALGFKPVILGGLGDGVRAASTQAAIALADAGLHRELDPNATNGSIADIISLPAALAGGVGFLTGAAERFDLGMGALKRAAGNETFAAGINGRARNLAAEEGPLAPGVLSAKERAYWDKATAANPDGRFFVDGLVTGHQGENVLFRTAEGLETRIPAREVDMVSEKGSHGIVVSADHLATSDALKASAMRLDGDFVGGGRPFLGDPTRLPEGSLASLYPEMRSAEAVRSGILDTFPEIAHGSLSAANTGAGATSRRPQLAGNRMVPTGIGLEKLPLDVVNRAAMLPFTTWQTTVEDMLSTGGRQRMKNTAAFGFQPSVNPVEMLIRTNWNRPAADVVRELRDQWEGYRRAAGGIGNSETDAGRIAFELKTTLKDKLGLGDGKLSFDAFRRRVGDAWINGDKDLVVDAASPQIEAAAKKGRALMERIKNEATDAGVFREGHEEQLAAAEAKLAGLKKDPLTKPEELDAAQHKIDKLNDLLQDVINGGPKVNTAKSYRPRIWLQDQLRERGAEFKQIVDDWLRQSNPNLSDRARRDISTDIHETLMRDKPVWQKEDVKKLFEDLGTTGSAKARTFEIPDTLVKDFLENDAEAIIRSHTRTMGTAIEMQKRFGSTGMEDQIAELWNEAQLLQKAAPDNAAKRLVMKQHATALADLQASRDRIYGVYGAPDDPHRFSSRAVRMAKQFTNLTTLGMSGITAMGDLMRPLMTEGLQAVHDYGFRTLASDMRAPIFRMARKDLEFAGDGMELILNTRALSMSDAGDLYRSRSGFERGLAKANSWFFVANGLNGINQLDKEWAGVIIQGKVNEALRQWGRTGKMEDWQRARLAAAGIGDDMFGRMTTQIEQNGGSFGKLRLAQLDKWDDEEAARTYASALNQMVNRTVPTPTLADTPNWMSSELGTLVAQYKSFQFGAMNRSLYAGLQEGGRQFWYGAAGMVGFAMILNEVRSRLFYDRSTLDKPMTATIADAVDRSSILGWFSDANKSIEVLTGHRAGIRPLVGAERPREESGARTIGSLAGPAAGQAVNALQVAGDFMAAHPTAKTWAEARQLIPGQNLPYLDPVLDRAISDGSYYPAKKSKGR